MVAQPPAAIDGTPRSVRAPYDGLSIRRLSATATTRDDRR